MKTGKLHNNQRSAICQWAVCCAFAVSGIGFTDEVTAQTVQEFSLTSGARPSGIVAGPDGNLWFTEQGLSRIGVMSPEGVVLREFPTTTPDMQPGFIVAGPDDNLWFVETSPTRHAIARVTPAGAMVEYPRPTAIGDIVNGPQDSLWFIEYGCAMTQDCFSRIVAISSPGTPVGTVFEEPIDASLFATRIIAPSDGNLWFTEDKSPGALGKMTTAGMLTNYATPSSHAATVASVGTDNSIWFWEPNVATLGKSDLSGMMKEFAFPASATTNIFSMTMGSDNNLWVGTSSGGVWRVIDMGTSISATKYPVHASVLGITPGPDGNLWFTESGVNKIGVVHMDGIFRDGLESN